jgi:hypothetical protein
MDIQALKIELTQLILNTDSKDLLKKFLVEIKKENRDFAADLTDDQKKEIEISRKQVKNGETESWESIMNRIS